MIIWPNGEEGGGNNCFSWMSWVQIQARVYLFFLDKGLEVDVKKKLQPGINSPTKFA